jgi:enoyl-CoA hydratase
MTDEVLLEHRGPVLVMTLNRPQKKNAMNAAMATALAAALDRLDSDAAVRVGVLTGAGSDFCAGMDLAAFLDGDVVEVPGRGLGGLTSAPPVTPLIAAVEGYALAGGLELALTCDLLVASSAARFGLPEVTRGLIAGAGGLVRLPQRLPRALALEYAMTGEQFDASTAAHWGLVNHVTEPGDALAVAVGLAEKIARNAPYAVRMTKHVVNAAPTWPADTLWERQKAVLEDVFASNDAREGAAAFAERRPPSWTGT